MRRAVLPGRIPPRPGGRPPRLYRLGLGRISRDGTARGFAGLGAGAGAWFI